MAQNYKKSGEYARVISFTDKEAHGVRTENMYIDYNREDISLESFPGYRKLAKLNGKINGIYTVENGSEVYLIHSGKNLYMCEFTNAYRDELNYQSIAVMNDRRSHGCLMNGELCIFDGEDVTLIDKTLTPKKLSQNPHLAYVPTTYINGKEAEELNILSESFYEKYEGITVSEMAYESEGLIYQIKNEKAKTCTVAGISGSVSGKVEIPSKKLINGSYYTVVEIGKNAFMGNKNITGLITSPTVQTVAENAFSGCSSLSFAAMVDGIESIDNSAFYGCTKLTQVYIGVSCKKIHFNAFYACNSLTYVYFSGDSSQIIECDGFSDMLRFEVEYWKPYKNLAIGIPIFTPAREIESLTVNGKEHAYASYVERGIIRVAYTDPGELEGATIILKEKKSLTTAHSSERAASFPLISGRIDNTSILTSAKGSAELEGRIFLYGLDKHPSIILHSTLTLEGKAEPLYFGELDYFSSGSPAYPISSVYPMGKSLAVAKTDEASGSIFIHTKKGEAANFGTTFPLTATLRGTNIKSGFGYYDDGLIFMDNEGACRLKGSSSNAEISPLHLGTLEQRGYGSDNTLFSSLGGYLAIFAKGALFLGDSRLKYSLYGKEQYRWFPIKDVGSFPGESRVYYYTDRAPEGYYLHPDEGAVAEGTVYSERGEDGRMIYYVLLGPRKYAVVPAEESFGGDLSPVSAIIKATDSIIFGTESSEIFALNTDKKGVPPRKIYQRDDFDPEEYKTAFANIIHPDFYIHGLHRAPYSVTTPLDNGDVPYAPKNSKRGSLTVRLGKRSREGVSVKVSTDSGEDKKILRVPMGEIDFEDLDFGNIAMSCENVENLSIPEKERKWIEKQITVYTDELKSPFAISSLSYGFSLCGKIKNK